MGWSAYRKPGLTHHHSVRSWKGYTLVTPTAGDATYLLDMDGQIVHRWYYLDLRVFYARLLPNGNLLAVGNHPDVMPTITPAEARGLPLNQRARSMGGNGSQLVEFNWDGERVWSYANECIHHDFVRLANGNTIMPQWVEMPEDVDRLVQGGLREPRSKRPKLISDDYIEIDPTGKEVRRVHLWELLDPRRDPICVLEERNEWTHTNSLDLNVADNTLLFSCRDNSRVGIIDWSDGSLKWKYGAPEIFHQHHASWLPNGNVQVFDNGMHRHGNPYSRVVEVDSKDSSITWQYAAKPQQQFFSGHISGAERQPNGNVLVCEGTAGRVFEITPQGEVVWEWISPFVTIRQGEPRTWIFRAHRYGPDDPALAGRELDAGNHRAMNRMFELGRWPRR
jgi:hypothetical protein